MVHKCEICRTPFQPECTSHGQLERFCGKPCQEEFSRRHKRRVEQEDGRERNRGMSPGGDDWKTPWGLPPIGARGRTGADSSSGPGFSHP